MTAGQDFVKRIGTVGCVLFLAAAVLVGALCLTLGRDPVPGYEPPQDTAYWQQHPEELAAELNENLLPKLDGGAVCSVAGGSVTVSVDGVHFAAVRSAVLRYYDRSLIIFENRG